MRSIVERPWQVNTSSNTLCNSGSNIIRTPMDDGRYRYIAQAIKETKLMDPSLWRRDASFSKASKVLLAGLTARWQQPEFLQPDSLRPQSRKQVNTLQQW